MSSANPLISVIVPCYNYGHYLSDTLHSILGQTVTNWECIIIDDGSTDTTKEIAEQFCSKDFRFIYTYQNNQGLSAARNKGIEIAKGEYIQFLDADDMIAPEKIKEQLNCFESKQEVDIVYSDYKLMDTSAQKYWSVDDTNWISMKHDAFIEFLCYWEKGFAIPIHCYLFKRSCFELWGNFDMELPTHEDLALQLNFSLNGAQYFMLTSKTSFYRVHSTSMARNYTNMHKGYLLALIKTLKHPKLNLNYRLLIIHRYCQEFLNTLLDTLRGRKNIFFTAVNNKGGWTLNGVAFILLPVYFIGKIISRYIN